MTLQLEADFERLEESAESIKDWAAQVYAAKWILKQLEEKVPTKSAIDFRWGESYF